MHIAVEELWHDGESSSSTVRPMRPSGPGVLSGAAGKDPTGHRNSKAQAGSFDLWLARRLAIGFNSMCSNARCQIGPTIWQSGRRTHMARSGHRGGETATPKGGRLPPRALLPLTRVERRSQTRPPLSRGALGGVSLMRPGSCPSGGAPNKVLDALPLEPEPVVPHLPA